MGACIKIAVPREVCYVRFTEDKPDHSDEIGTTSRGEMMIADFNAQGQIIGIELVGPHKPCQTG